jgi:hypothetical protein
LIINSPPIQPPISPPIQAPLSPITPLVPITIALPPDYNSAITEKREPITPIEKNEPPSYSTLPKIMKIFR